MTVGFILPEFYSFCVLYVFEHMITNSGTSVQKFARIFVMSARNLELLLT